MTYMSEPFVYSFIRDPAEYNHLERGKDVRSQDGQTHNLEAFGEYGAPTVQEDTRPLMEGKG